jgi:hypothetical protein
MSSDLFTRNVSEVIIGAGSDLAVDALSMTLDLFAIGLEDGDSMASILKKTVYGVTIAAETVMR